MREVAISVLGGVETRVEGRLVPLAGSRQRALLVLLALGEGRVISVDRLVDELWGSAPPASARTQVHTLVHRLRRALGGAGPLIETRRPGYALRTDAARVDAIEFAERVTGARAAVTRGDPAVAALRFRDGLALWRGPALDGVAGSFVQREAARLEESRLVAWEECAELELSLGRHGAVAADLTALVAEHPLREELRRLLMLALHHCGRRTQALEVYRHGRAVLIEETGLEPGRPLRDLESAILRADPGPHAPAPPPGTPRSPATMSPVVRRAAGPAPASRPPSGPASRSRPGAAAYRRRRSLMAVVMLLVLSAVAGEVSAGPGLEPGAGPAVVPATESGPQWIPGPAWVSDPPKAVSPAFFGVTVGTASGAMPTFRTGGVRLWDSRTRWANVQPERTRFDWRILDRLVEGARRRRLPVLYTMGITPAWAAPDGARSAYADGSRTAPPDDPADWDAYVRAVASRYRGRIHAYEIWDYANAPTHYTGDAATLASMVRRAAEIIRSVDERATVVCPSIGDLWEPHGRAFLYRFALLNGFQTCDAAAVKIHPRDLGGRPEEMVEEARVIDNVLHSAGVHMPMWATGPGHAIPSTRPLSETDANNYAVRFYLVGLYIRYRRMFFYSWGVGGLPLVLQVEGSPPTRAAGRVQRLQRWLTGARIRSCGRDRADGLPPNVWQCRFQVPASGGGTEEAAVRWTAEGATWMRADPGTHRVDHLDGRTAPVRSGQPVPITERPVMFRIRPA